MPHRRVRSGEKTNGGFDSADAAAAPRARDSLLEFSHDVRQCVGTILALVAAGREQLDADRENAQYLDGIESSARWMSALCRHTVAKTHGVRVVSVDDVVTAIVRTARQRFDVTIEVILMPVTMVCDEVTLTRMLENLVDNACRAADRDGRVTVTVRRVDGSVQIEVCDSGPGFGGLPPPGECLGLAIVQSAAQRLGGHVTVGEASLGGAQLAVTLPAIRDDAGRLLNLIEDASCIKT